MHTTQGVKIHPIKQLGALALVLTGIGVGMVLVSSNQDIRQQASVGNFDSLDCSNGDCDVILPTAGSSYVSTQGSYKVVFDENRWKQTSLPASASKEDKENTMFVYKNKDGFASVYLNATPLSTAEQSLSINEFAQQIKPRVSQAPASKWGEKVSYTGVDFETIGQTIAIKLNYEVTFLGKTVPYAEYIIKGHDHYLEAETRLIHTPAATEAVKAFLAGITVDPQEISKVKGASTNLDETKLTEMVKPSVVSILHTYCKDIRIRSGEQLSILKSSYPFCDGGFGSGFVVQENGLVATNGHVVVTYPEEDIIGGLMNENPGVVMFVVDFVRESLLTQGLLADRTAGLQITGYLLSDPTKAQALLESLYKLLDDKLVAVESTHDNFYVNTGLNPFELDKDKGLTPSTFSTFVKLASGQYKANLSTYDFGNRFAKSVILDKEAVKGSDVALIKLENNSGYKFPALELTTAANVKEGETITIIGYPGLVSGNDNNGLLDYKSSSTQATVTRGIVSSIKKDTDGNNLIQTDASIEHGNSGGPAFNQKGQVIGIATYGFQSQGGNYNFLRDVADLQKLAEKKALTLADSKETYDSWTTGLGFYWNDRYTRSVKHLSKVATNYPQHPSVQEYIDSAKEAIKAGKDVDLIFGIEKTYVYIGGSVIGMLFLTGVVLFLINRKNHPATVNFTQGSTPSAYAQQPVANVTASAISPSFAAMASTYPAPTVTPPPAPVAQAPAAVTPAPVAPVQPGITGQTETQQS